MENNEVLLTRNEADMLEFSQSAKQGFVKPDVWNVEIPFENATLPHSIIIQNFVNAILDGEPLLVPGAEGMHSVELANVMVYSSMINETVTLPLDGAAWEKKLNQLIAESKVVKKVVKVETTDFASSFRR